MHDKINTLDITILHAPHDFAGGASVNLKYVKGSYMDEIMVDGRPVLFTLDGLPEGREEQAQQYAEEIWNWVLEHQSQVVSHAPLIAGFKNKKWRSEGEPEVSADDIIGCLQRITSIYATYQEGFDVFFDTNAVFEERSLVISIGKSFFFEGFKLL